MTVNLDAYRRITAGLGQDVTLVAVSKLKSPAEIMLLYEQGHRDFGENYVQELIAKREQLPADIRWHFIGHLQSNKVKYIAPFIHLIQGVDSVNLLKEINKQGKKQQRVLRILLQMHIAREETKFGLDEAELDDAMKQLPSFPHVEVAGLMGMASLTENTDQVKKEFAHLRSLFDRWQPTAGPAFQHLSMGMSGDYQLALEQGSNMVRIGSLLFGAR